MAKKAVKKKALPPGLERDALVRKLYATKGMTQSKMSRELGVSRQRVFQLIDELKIKRRARPTRAERMKKIPALIEAGLSGQEMAQHLQVHKSIFYLDLEAVRPKLSKRLLQLYYDNGSNRRSEKAKGRPHPLYADAITKRQAAVLGLIDQGKTLGQIGVRFKVSGQTIRNDLKRLGLTKRLEAKIQANRVAQAGRTRAKNAKGR